MHWGLGRCNTAKSRVENSKIVRPQNPVAGEAQTLSFLQSWNLVLPPPPIPLGFGIPIQPCRRPQADPLPRELRDAAPLRRPSSHALSQFFLAPCDTYTYPLPLVGSLFWSLHFGPSNEPRAVFFLLTHWPLPMVTSPSLQTPPPPKAKCCGGCRWSQMGLEDSLASWTRTKRGGRYGRFSLNSSSRAAPTFRYRLSFLCAPPGSLSEGWFCRGGVRQHPPLPRREGVQTTPPSLLT